MPGRLAVAALIVGMAATLSPAPARAADANTADAAPGADALAFYKTQVQPILAHNCLKCHGGEPKIKAGLNLTARDTILKGGDTGPAVNLEQPDKSLLLAAVSYEDEFIEMPPKGKLDQKDIDVLTKWVRMGAPMPADQQTAGHTEKKHEPRINDETRNHWSFRPVQRPDVPKVKDAAWVTNPIDAFILARRQAVGLKSNGQADRATLIRRAYYDLLGLPPTPQQVNGFVNDTAPDAWGKLIDQLLASPHYGEKWGRHWLDLVHYAESNSFERDNPKPDVWRYRDYIIRSFNDDKPYDQFIREQLAGDELDEVTADSIIATGYYRLGLWDDESADPPQSRYDEMDDWLTVTSQVMLGLTMNCARCHDHKLDPIPQEDYYRFLAFFRDVKSFQNGADGMGKGFADGNFHRKLSDFMSARRIQTAGDRYARLLRQFEEAEQALADLHAQITDKLPGGVRDDFQYESNQLHIATEHSPKLIPAALARRFIAAFEQREALRRQLEMKDAKVLCISTQAPPQTHLLIRGNPGAHGKEVSPGFPQVLGFEDPVIVEPQGRPRAGSDADPAGRRRALAEWIASEKNPLTARVMANRIWQHHFGRGIVGSANDLGLQGEKPTHPQLLDWLAAEFVSRGWRLKEMHRLIMTSSAYRMASSYDPDGFTKDPTNDLFWRFNMRRLTAEEVRDSILAVNGRLNPQMYGPSVYTVIPREVLAGQSKPGHNWGDSDERQRARRSVYIHVKRSLIEPFLEQFDFPDVDNTCPVRFTTTLPTQALGMLNSEFMNRQADVLAKRLEKEAGQGVEAQVKRALSLVTQRQPTQPEITRGVRLIESLKKEDGVSEHEALRYFCLVMLNLNEFVYLD